MSLFDNDLSGRQRLGPIKDFPGQETNKTLAALASHANELGPGNQI